MAWHSTWNEPRDRRRPGFFVDRGGWLSPGVKLVLFLTVGVFLGEMLWPTALTDGGALTVRSLLRLQVWRLVTYMFLHASTDHILINMFMFWMLGVALERQMGTKSFLWLYFTAGVLGGLFEVVFNCLMFVKYGPVYLDNAGHTFLTMPAVGASAGVAGILVAFATRNPRAEFLLFFIFPIEAWIIALVYVLVETRHVVLALMHGWMVDNVAHAAHFGGMVLGFLWIKWGDRVGRGWRGRVRPPRERPGLRTTAEEQAEMDRILEKIHREGVESLTLREKMFLQEMSSRKNGE